VTKRIVRQVLSAHPERYMRHTYGGSSQDLNSFLRQCRQRRGLVAADAFRLFAMSIAGHMIARSFLARHYTGFPDRRSRPFRINFVITPAVHERTDVNLTLPLASGGFDARLSVADDVPTLSVRRNSEFD
jgi:hypothetical protein